MTNQQTQYEIHPAATIFPMMDEESFAALKADIQKNGLEKVITFYQGKVLDGRNRCEHVKNLELSHMEKKSRTMAAARLIRTSGFYQ